MNEQELEQIEKRYKDIELPDSGFVSAEYRLPYPEETYGDWMLLCHDDWSGTQTIAQRIESEEIARFMAGAFQDIPALIAEVRRLKADLEHLSTVGESLATSLDGVKAENARMKAALLEINDLMITPWLVKDIIHSRVGDIVFEKGGEG